MQAKVMVRRGGNKLLYNVLLRPSSLTDGMLYLKDVDVDVQKCAYVYTKKIFRRACIGIYP